MCEKSSLRNLERKQFYFTSDGKTLSYLEVTRNYVRYMIESERCIDECYHQLKLSVESFQKAQEYKRLLNENV